uniref:SusC/RagA family TonB-linked outer membrane protein n=1 Tax=Pedobacter schmidteae TaxID=2201271 RepID=UPI000EAF814A|nr:SusC/RagA family TonB-linked outer membrane protein [Pedobacter schmidteae]
MRLKGGIIVFILSLFGIAVHAQKLNYVQKNSSLARLFKEIRKQTGVTVTWSEKDLDVSQRFDADFKHAELKLVMEELAARLPVTYTILEKMIVVKVRKITDNLQNAANAPPGTSPVPLRPDREVQLKEVEIVSTGYQQVPRERTPGSFVRVDSAQLNRKVGSDIFSRLEGITSGLLFNKNTLSSNSGNLDLSIRGRSTIYANDQPLIILNDFPFNGDFNAINPNDVASVTVLKDAAAASIWGVRAGNGVIVINTKKGGYKQPLNISLNTNLTISGKPDVFYNPNYLSSADFIDVETFLFNNGKYDAALADKVNYPVLSPVVQILDRQRNGQSAAVTASQLDALRGNDIRREELKYFYQNQVAQQYFLNISKGTDKSSHYLSAGYDRALLSLVNNVDNRFTVNTQHSVKLLKNLELNAGLTYTRTVSKVDSTILGTAGLNFGPYYQFKDENGAAATFGRQYSADFNAQAMAKGFLNWGYVPLDELSLPPTTVKGNDLRFNTSLNYTILPGLKAELRYQYHRITNNSTLLSGPGAYLTRSLINQYSALTAGQVSGYNIPLGGIEFQTLREAVAKNFRAQLNYQKDWGKHSVSAIAGYELSEFDTEASKSNRYGYDPKTGKFADVDSVTTFNLNPSGAGKIVTNTNLFGKLDRIRSVFANLAYTYNNKYTVSGSARMDGSNYFGVKTRNKNVPLWSAGALWHVDREDFYKMDWLPVLKLRASYGYNGNLDRSNTGVTTFKNNLLRATYTSLPFANIINIGNPELRWEKIAIANFGLDFGLKDQIISGRVEYYFKHGTDMLGDKAFPSSTGIKVLRGNYSEMKSRGMDLSVTVRNLGGALKWQSTFLLSTARDKVTVYDVVETDNIFYVGTSSYKPALGKPVYGIYSYKWAGLDPANGAPRGYLNGAVSTEYARILNETSIADLEYHGAARPTVFGALNNTFSFYKFTLGFNISYKLGYYFRKPSVNYFDMYQISLSNNMNRDYVQRWQKPGDEQRTNVPAMANYGSDGTADRFYNNSSATVAKGDHIRLQDISLSFDLDRSNWKSIPVKHIQLYFYANNLGIIWKANEFGLDPDVIPSTTDRLINPGPRSFSLGIKANF